MTSAQEKWSQTVRVNVQGGNLVLSLSWISPVAAAGIASALACHPLEVLKDRLTVSRDIYPNLSIAIRKIYKDGGNGALHAGISPTLTGMLPCSTCYYFMYGTMETSYCEAKNKKSLNRPEMLLIGALAGFTASTLSFPLEVARKRLMAGALQGKCPPHMAAAVSEVIREEGTLQRLGCRLFNSDRCLRLASLGCFMKLGKMYCLLRDRFYSSFGKNNPASCSFGAKCFTIKTRRKEAPSLLVNVPRTPHRIPHVYG